jgi:hypothetical protein
LYWYLEFEAKRLCREADIRGADGDEFATGDHQFMVQEKVCASFGYGGTGTKTV